LKLLRQKEKRVGKGRVAFGAERLSGQVNLRPACHAPS
jgi:hypothetical protein